MVDLVKIHISAGNGGDGRISFFRNRRTLKGGPDGGDGGTGGSVIITATGHENTLRNFAGVANIEAENGQMGGVTNMHGKDQEDVVIALPIGTRVWRVRSSYIPNEPKRMYRNDKELGRVERAIERRASSQIRQNKGVFTLTAEQYPVLEDTDEPRESTVEVIQQSTIKIGATEYEVDLIGDLTKEGQRMMIARGGRGGRGNESFKSSRNTTPMECQTGEGGESGDFIFELQLIADVGLVGFPNAGKSTLLSVLTKANPKIANYPFTTLEPNLGVMTFDAANATDRRSVVIADLPGLIEGASEGKGLGHAFLRHVSRCRMLAFLLSLDDAIILDEEVDTKTLCVQYREAYQTLEHELESYEREAKNIAIPFAQKRRIVVLSKADLVDPGRRSLIQKNLQNTFPNIFWISSGNGEGLDMLRKEIALMIQ